MTAIPFQVGDCVLVYNYLNDGYDKYTLQRKRPDVGSPGRLKMWDAISDKGEPAILSEYEMEHAPREQQEIVGSIIVALGVIGVLLGAAFAIGMFHL